MYTNCISLSAMQTFRIDADNDGYYGVHPVPTSLACRSVPSLPGMQKKIHYKCGTAFGFAVGDAFRPGMQGTSSLCRCMTLHVPT